VTDFVEECRREWRRLDVPDPVANEMAADLAADLKEAEAEGVSPEEVLGSGAFDPRSFAASWAAERGVSRPSPARERVSRRSFIPAAIAALVVIAVTGAALAIFASPSGSVSAPVMRASGPSGHPVPVTPQDLHADVSGVDARTVGTVLLVVGLAGIVLLTLFWLWLRPGRWSSRHTYIDERPTGPAY
jgi:hypothetical protein